LPRNTGRIQLHRQSWTVPASLPFADDSIVPLRAGQPIAWKMQSL